MGDDLLHVLHRNARSAAHANEAGLVALGVLGLRETVIRGRHDGCATIRARRSPRGKRMTTDGRVATARSSFPAEKPAAAGGTVSVRCRAAGRCTSAGERYSPRPQGVYGWNPDGQ
eukprot:6212420-Pleurochrysis_carterae.AAC.6